MRDVDKLAEIILELADMKIFLHDALLLHSTPWNQKSSIVKTLLIGIFLLLCLSISGPVKAQGYDAAAQWLITKQMSSGAWGENETPNIRDTQRTLDALTACQTPECGTAKDNAKAWLLAYEPTNTDELARKILALHILGEDITALRQELLSRKTELTPVTFLSTTYPHEPIPAPLPAAGFRHSADPDSAVTMMDSLLGALAIARTGENDEQIYDVLNWVISQAHRRIKDEFVFVLSRDLKNEAQLYANLFAEIVASIGADAPLYKDALDIFQQGLYKLQQEDGGWGSKRYAGAGSSTVYQTALIYVALARLRERFGEALPLSKGNPVHYSESRRKAQQYLATRQDPAGHWNANVYDTAMAALALRYGQWYINATVSASKVAFEPVHVVEKRDYQIHAQIDNVGDRDIENLKVAFYDGPQLTGTFIGEQTIPLIASFKSTAVTVQWNTTVPVGAHSVHVVVDPDNVFAEFNEDDNTAVVPVTVNTGEADIVIVSAEYDIGPPTQRFFFINMVVQNVGGAHPQYVPGDDGTTHLLFRLYDGDPQNGGVPLPEFDAQNTVGLIPGYANQMDPNRILLENLYGYHDFYLEADANHALPENTASSVGENNNIYHIGEVILPTQLWISDTQVSNTQPLSGEFIEVSADVSFWGTALVAENAAMSFYNGYPSTDNQIGETYIFPGLSDHSTERTPPVQFDTSGLFGEIDLYAVVRHETGLFRDNSPADNIVKIPILVRNPAPDLTVKFLDSQFKGMETSGVAHILVDVEIQNISDTAFTQATLVFHGTSDGSGDIIHSETITAIQPLETRVVPVLIKVPNAGDGLAEFSVRVNGTNPTDQNAANNLHDSYLRVAPGKTILFAEHRFPYHTIDLDQHCDPISGECVLNSVVSQRRGRLQPFAQALRDRGYVVDKIPRNIASKNDDTLTRERLKQADILVVNGIDCHPNLFSCDYFLQDKWTDRELDLVIEFVQRGGSFLFIAECPRQPFYWFKRFFDPMNITQGKADIGDMCVWTHEEGHFLGSECSKDRHYQIVTQDLINPEFSEKYDVHTINPRWMGYFENVPDSAVVFFKSGMETNGYEWNYPNKVLAFGIDNPVFTGKGKVAVIPDSDTLDCKCYSGSVNPRRGDLSACAGLGSCDNLKFGLGVIDWLSTPPMEYRDLFVTDEDVRVSLPEQYKTEKVSVSIDVHRLGFYGENVPVSYYLKNNSGYSEHVRTLTIDELRYGFFRTATMEWAVGEGLTVLPAGEYFFEIVVNPDFVHAEDDHTNNIARSGMFIIKDLPVPEEFRATVTTARQQYTNDETVTIPLRLENHTHYSLYAGYMLSIFGPDGKEISPRLAYVPPTGELSFSNEEAPRTLTYSWNTAAFSPGQYSIRLTNLKASKPVAIIQQDAIFEIIPPASYTIAETDKAVYQYGQDTVNINYTVTCNPYEARDVEATIRIIDTDKFPVKVLSQSIPISFAAPGLSQSGTLQWDPTGHYPGSYKVQLLLHHDGRIVDEKNVAFTVEEAPALEAVFHADQIDYTTAESVGLNLKLLSHNKQLMLNDIDVRIWFEDAASSVFSKEFTKRVPLISAGSYHEINEYISAAALGPGVWTAKVTAIRNGILLSEASDQFEIIPSEITGAGFNGKVTVVSNSGTVINCAETFRIAHELTNYSSMPTIPANTPIIFSMYRQDTEALEQEWTLPLASPLPQRETTSGSKAIDGKQYAFQAGSYFVVMSLEINGTRFPLSLYGFDILGGNPTGNIVSAPAEVDQGQPFNVDVDYFNNTGETRQNVKLKLFINTNPKTEVFKSYTEVPYPFEDAHTFENITLDATPGNYLMILSECRGTVCQTLDFQGITIMSYAFRATVSVTPRVQRTDVPFSPSVQYSIRNISGNEFPDATLYLTLYDEAGTVLQRKENTGVSLPAIMGAPYVGTITFDSVSFPQAGISRVELSGVFQNGLSEVSVAFAELQIINTPPKAPSNVSAMAREGSYSLTWAAPTLRADGMELRDLAGYNAYLVQEEESGLTYTLLNSAPIPETETQYSLDALTAGQEYTLVMTAMDSFGLESVYSPPAKVFIDGTPPVTNAQRQPANGDWIKGDATITLNASDWQSGVWHTRHCMQTWSETGCDPYDPISGAQGSMITVNTTGRHQVCFASTDHAGNRETPQCVNVFIDRARPVTHANWLPGPDRWSTWVGDDVLIEFTVDDAGESGDAETYHCISYVMPSCDPLNPAEGRRGGAVSITQGGKAALCYGSIDKAGNKECDAFTSCSCKEVWIDREPPVSVSFGYPVTLEWFNFYPTVKFSATDEHSNPSVVYACVADSNSEICDPFDAGQIQTQLIVTEPGHNVICFAGQDSIGNRESPKCININLDAVPPMVSVAGYVEPYAWVHENVTITMTAEDATSGVKSLRYCFAPGAGSLCLPSDSSYGIDVESGSQIFVEEQGIRTVCVIAQDIANNTSSSFLTPSCFEIWLDKSAPVTYIKGLPLAGRWASTNVLLTFDASDSPEDEPWTHGSGVENTYYCIPAGGETECDPYETGNIASELGVNIAADVSGAAAICFGSTDHSGLHEAPQCIDVRIDTVKPAVFATTNPSLPNPPNWVQDDVTVTITAQDDHSGISGIYHCVVDITDTVQACSPYTQGQPGDTVVITDNGINGKKWRVCYGATDNAGWNADWSCIDIWKKDMPPAAPVITTIEGQDAHLFMIAGADTSLDVCGDKEAGTSVTLYMQGSSEPLTQLQKTDDAAPLTVTGADYTLTGIALEKTDGEAYNGSLGATQGRAYFMNAAVGFYKALPYNIPSRGANHLYAYLVTIDPGLSSELHVTLYSDDVPEVFQQALQSLSAAFSKPMQIDYYAAVFRAATPGAQGGVLEPIALPVAGIQYVPFDSGMQLLAASPADDSTHFCINDTNIGTQPGQKSLYAVSTDASGKTSAPSNHAAYYLDLTPPEPPVLITANNKDFVANSVIANIPLAAFTGTAESCSKVSIYARGLGSQTPVPITAPSGSDMYAQDNGSGAYTIAAPAMMLDGTEYNSFGSAMLFVPDSPPMPLNPPADVAEIDGSKDIWVYLTKLYDFMGNPDPMLVTWYTAGGPDPSIEDQTDAIMLVHEFMKNAGQISGYAIDAYGTAFINQGAGNPYTALTSIQGKGMGDALIAEANTPCVMPGQPSAFTASVTGQVSDLDRDGQFTLYAMAENAWGLVSGASADYTYLLDRQPPMTSHAPLAEWYTDSTTVDLRPYDPGGANTAYTLFCIDNTDSCLPNEQPQPYPFNIPVTQEGVNYVRYQSVDHAGNIETEVHTAVVRIDRMAPVTTANIPADWVNQSVQVSLIANDSGSGIARTLYCTSGPSCMPDIDGTSITFDSQDIHYLNYYSVDIAGNQEPVTTAQIRIDKSSPYTDAQVPSGVQSGDVTVQIVGYDSLSGIRETKYCIVPGGSTACAPSEQVQNYQVTITGEGEWSICFHSVDNAGNQETDKCERVIIDNTPPDQPLISHFLNKSIDLGPVFGNVPAPSISGQVTGASSVDLYLVGGGNPEKIIRAQGDTSIVRGDWISSPGLFVDDFNDGVWNDTWYTRLAEQPAHLVNVAADDTAIQAYGNFVLFSEIFFGIAEGNYAEITFLIPDHGTQPKVSLIFSGLNREYMGLSWVNDVPKGEWVKLRMVARPSGIEAFYDNNPDKYLLADVPQKTDVDGISIFTSSHSAITQDLRAIRFEVEWPGGDFLIDDFKSNIPVDSHYWIEGPGLSIGGEDYNVEFSGSNQPFVLFMPTLEMLSEIPESPPLIIPEGAFVPFIDGTKDIFAYLLKFTLYGVDVRITLYSIYDYEDFQQLMDILLLQGVGADSYDIVAYGKILTSNGLYQPYTPEELPIENLLSTSSTGVWLGEAIPDSSGNYVLPQTVFDLTPDGPYQIFAVAKDDAGNKSASSKIETYILDTVPPVIQIAAPGSSADEEYIHSQNDIPISYTVTDAPHFPSHESQLVSSAILERQEAPNQQVATDADKDGIDAIGKNDIIGTLPAGNWQFIVEAQDLAGNTAAATSTYPFEVIHDIMPPRTSHDYSSVGSPINHAVTVTLSAVDDLVIAGDGIGLGVGSLSYCLDEINACTPDIACTDTSLCPVDITTEGTHYLRYMAQDVLGNTESVQSLEVTIDTTPPNVCRFLDPIERAPWNFLFGTEKTVVIEAADNKQIASVEFLYENALVGTASSIGNSMYEILWNFANEPHGWHPISARCSDTSGNTAQQTINVFLLFTAAPTVTFLYPSDGLTVPVLTHTQILYQAPGFGRVSYVDVYDGGVLIASREVNSREGILELPLNLTPGAHVLTAKAYLGPKFLNQVSVSDPVHVTAVDTMPAIEIVSLYNAPEPFDRLGSAVYAELNQPADDVEIQILNSSGTVVRQLTDIVRSGILYTAYWNGRTGSVTGPQAPAGYYTIRVIARSGPNETIRELGILKTH